MLDSNDLFYKDFEPQLSHRFYMYIDSVPAYIIKAASKPALSINSITIDHINMKRYVQGKGEWETLPITLYSPINPSGAQSVMEWIRLGYEWTTGRTGYSDFYKKEVTLDAIGPVGDIVEEWVLKGAWITSVNWGKFDWSDDSLINIDATIRYDYAVLNF